MKNKVEDLRNHLFAQLERLSDEEAMKNPITLDREVKITASMVEISNVLIESARAETEFLKAVSDNPTLLDSPFFNILDSEKKLLTQNNKK